MSSPVLPARAPPAPPCLLCFLLLFRFSPLSSEPVLLPDLLHSVSLVSPAGGKFKRPEKYAAVGQREAGAAGSVGVPGAPHTRRKATNVVRIIIYWSENVLKPNFRLRLIPDVSSGARSSLCLRSLPPLHPSGRVAVGTVRPGAAVERREPLLRRARLPSWAREQVNKHLQGKVGQEEDKLKHGAVWEFYATISMCFSQTKPETEE